MNLFLATRNKGKLAEIKEALADFPLTLVSLNEIIIDDQEFIEDGSSFQENARKKALYYSKKAKMLTLADDSGILVDALQGELGIKTRRWGAGEKATDKEWLEYFMKRMAEEKNRRATFICCMCLADPEGKILFEAEGLTEGEITKTIEAPIKPGIPLSSVFKPQGCSKVHSALSMEEKNKVSHRGKALGKVKVFMGAFRSHQFPTCL